MLPLSEVEAYSEVEAVRAIMSIRPDESFL